MKKIAVFASGFGSNFQNLIDAQKTGKMSNGEISILISDKPDAYAVKRARENDIPIFSFKAKDYRNKEDYESKIVEVLQQEKVDFIVLAGFMRIVGKTLLQAYPNKIINLHPSLLPAFPGKAAIEQAFDYGVKVTGVTVHYIDEGMDTGPIIKQKAVYIDNTDDVESLTKKIHLVEHELLLETVNLLTEKNVVVDQRLVKY